MLDRDQLIELERCLTLETGEVPFKESNLNGPSCSYANMLPSLLADRWFYRVKGFGYAADVILKAALSGRLEHYEVNSVIYPALFLVRHYLEIVMKALIEDIWAAQGQAKSAPKGHNLLKLWKICRKALEEFGELSLTLDRVQDCIENFDAYDPGSTNFRYPANKPKAALPKNLDLVNLQVVLQKLVAHFEGWETGVHEYRIQLQENRAY